MQSIMISIQPKWVEKILNGEKTIEIRKTTPKCELPCKVYIYCTKPKKWYAFSSWGATSNELLWKIKDKAKMCDVFEVWDEDAEKLNGKIVAEFTLKRVEKFSVGSLRCDDIEALSCVSYKEMIDYFFKSEELDGNHFKFGYAWHIENLKIYNKPKLLHEFFKPCGTCDKIGTERCGEEYSDCRAKVISKAPQDWCYIQADFQEQEEL